MKTLLKLIMAFLIGVLGTKCVSQANELEAKDREIEKLRKGIYNIKEEMNS